MPRKRHKPEEIVAKLRQGDVLVAQGTPVAVAVRSIGVTEVASGRASQWGDLLLSAGSADRHRELEMSLQQCAPACLPGLPPTGSGGLRARLRRLAGCATPTGSAGQAPRAAKADTELTSNPDHPRGADHRLRSDARGAMVADHGGRVDNVGYVRRSTGTLGRLSAAMRSVE